ncbi:MAG: MSMEG_0567/Sll0786 family nitrogen starvation N-acetyltransferase [Janthinobacterium lividum]
MLLEPVAAYVPSEFRVKFVGNPWEKQQAAHLRRMVFCVEQQLFEHDDTDDIDAIEVGAITLAAFACVAGMPEQIAGTVRIHEAEPGVWRGSRLAIHPAFRGHAHLAAGLIRLAVSSAHARGCRQFLAQVQSQNARLFRRLHWQTLREIAIHGRAHHEMQADLDWYPPFADGDCGFVTLDR